MVILSSLLRSEATKGAAVRLAPPVFYQPVIRGKRCLKIGAMIPEHDFSDS